jgi:hypothetical protein
MLMKHTSSQIRRCPFFLIASSLLANKLDCFLALPEAYAPGSKEGASCFSEVLGAAWVKHPLVLKRRETQKTK